MDNGAVMYKLASLWTHVCAVGYISSEREGSEVPVFLEPNMNFFITYIVFISEVKSGVSRLWVLCMIICYFSCH